MKKHQPLGALETNSPHVDDMNFISAGANDTITFAAYDLQGNKRGVYTGTIGTVSINARTLANSIGGCKIESHAYWKIRRISGKVWVAIKQPATATIASDLLTKGDRLGKHMFGTSIATQERVGSTAIGAVTASDTVNITYGGVEMVPIALMVSTPGTYKLTTANGDDVSVYLAAGIPHYDLNAVRVWSTGSDYTAGITAIF